MDPQAKNIGYSHTIVFSTEKSAGTFSIFAIIFSVLLGTAGTHPEDCSFNSHPGLPFLFLYMNPIKAQKTIVFNICVTQTIAKDVIFVFANIDNLMK